MFSKACEYGIKASIFIAINSLEGRRVSPREIAEEIDSPQAFTAKILQALVRHNVINSVQGAYGGFHIDKNKIPNTMLADIVNAIDGDKIYKGCGLGMSACDDIHPCPVHDKFVAIRSELKTMLETTNLEQLAMGITSGASFLKV